MTESSSHTKADPYGIWAIHASAVLFGHKAVAFLGPSGTGKSTICQLLSHYTDPLAYDMVYLVPNESGIYVARADRRAAKGALSKQEAQCLKSEPLEAVVRLYQANTLLLQPISSILICRYLVNALFEIRRQRLFNPHVKKMALADLANVARTIRGFELQFDTSHEVFPALESVIMN